MNRLIRIPNLLLVFALGLCACEHKELCFDHDAHTPKSNVRICADYLREWEIPDGGPDWSAFPDWEQAFGMEYDDLRPGIPEGLRVEVYNADGSHGTDNIPPEGGVVNMIPGEHAILLYNNDTEYILFGGMQASATATASTRTRTRSSYRDSPLTDGGERTVNPPDMLYAGFIPSYLARRDIREQVLPVRLHPLVFTYLVRYRFDHGLEYVALARGALAGMARSVLLGNGRTTDGAATLLYDCTLHPFGAQAVVHSFGTPDTRCPVRGSRHALNLEVRLKNGRVKRFDFDVTDQLEAQPRGGVVEVGGIVITDEEGNAGGSGFEVDVDDWGEYEDVEIPLE